MKYWTAQLTSLPQIPVCAIWTRTSLGLRRVGTGLSSNATSLTARNTKDGFWRIVNFLYMQRSSARSHTISLGWFAETMLSIVRVWLRGRKKRCYAVWCFRFEYVQPRKIECRKVEYTDTARQIQYLRSWSQRAEPLRTEPCADYLDQSKSLRW